MEFNIEDFLPKYPDINPTDNIIMDPYYGTNFYQAIYNKKEFNELRLEREEQRPPPGQPYRHQQMIARFLSPYTLYSALLLDHEMGTGKSCSAFSAIEHIKNSSNAFKGALVLTRGPRVLSNLMKELVYVCTAGQYKPDESERRLTENERKRRLTKLTSEFYTFDTFEKFSKNISKMSDENIKKVYSNMVIVLDEVHNLRVREGAKSYDQIHRLLHTVKNCKIIIMSGTPMKDDPSEIAAILNLILPTNKQLPTGKEFKRQFLNERGEGLSVKYTIKENKKQELKSYMKGYVSYLKSMTSDVEVVYNGKSLEPLEHFKVVPTTMSFYQTRAYKSAYETDTHDSNVDMANVNEEPDNASGIYSNSRQASLFVFPDGSYGKAGFDKYFTKIEKGQLFQYIPKETFLSAIRGDDKTKTLENIKKFSSTYWRIITTIIDNPDKLHFVYDSFVHGSGSVVLGKLLQLTGFVVASGLEQTKKDRYAILTNSTASQQTVNNIIERFNSPDNIRGDYIKVIIGSKILAEGITLKNVLSIHIATPHWNYSELAQAIARGIRLESHRDLINADKGRSPVVNVYQHVALPVGDDGFPSIDLQMYTLCEAKDISIKAVERLIKESAVDCAIFYERNRAGKTAVDGSRECDYQDCMYRCDGIPSLEDFEQDYSTYDLYYKSKTGVTDDIIRLFEINPTLTLDEIMSKLGRDYTPFDIISELKYLITSNIPIKNRLDIPCYLKEMYNVYFLVDSISAGDDFLSSVYARMPVIADYSSFGEAATQSYIDSIKRNENVEYCFGRLPLKYKQCFIETIIDTLDTPIKTPAEGKLRAYVSEIIDDDRNGYTLGENKFTRQEDGEWIVTERKAITKPKKTTAADIDYTPVLGTTVLEKFSEDKVQPTDKYIGLYNKDTKVFCVRRIIQETMPDVKKDTRTKTVGRVCSTMSIPALILIIVDLRLPYREVEGNLTQKTVDAINAKIGAQVADVDDDGNIVIKFKDGTKEVTSLISSDIDKKIILSYIGKQKKELCIDIFTDLLQKGKIFLSDECGSSSKARKTKPENEED